uniref:Ig-like domain-containing protein n=1 Tax=Hucho hucho TaxID=62062 RepID=A0A4W5LHG4_9TELE
MSLLRCLLLFYFSFNELTTAAGKASCFFPPIKVDSVLNHQYGTYVYLNLTTTVSLPSFFSIEAILWVKTGEKFTMKCSTTLKDQDGMYLYVGLDRDREVLYYYQRDSKLTPRKRYWDRVKTEGPVDQLTITVSNLTIQDTGVYWCFYTNFNEITYENDINQGRGSTLVVVNGRSNEKPCPSCMVNIISIIIIITSLLTILLCVIFLIWVVPRVSVRMVARVMGPSHVSVKTLSFINKLS